MIKRIICFVLVGIVALTFMLPFMRVSATDLNWSYFSFYSLTCMEGSFSYNLSRTYIVRFGGYRSNSGNSNFAYFSVNVNNIEVTSGSDRFYLSLYNSDKSSSIHLIFGNNNKFNAYAVGTIGTYYLNLDYNSTSLYKQNYSCKYEPSYVQKFNGVQFLSFDDCSQFFYEIRNYVFGSVYPFEVSNCWVYTNLLTAFEPGFLNGSVFTSNQVMFPFKVGLNTISSSISPKGYYSAFIISPYDGGQVQLSHDINNPTVIYASKILSNTRLLTYPFGNNKDYQYLYFTLIEDRAVISYSSTRNYAGFYSDSSYSSPALTTVVSGDSVYLEFYVKDNSPSDWYFQYIDVVFGDGSTGRYYTDTVTNYFKIPINEGGDVSISAVFKQKHTVSIQYNPSGSSADNTFVFYGMDNTFFAGDTVHLFGTYKYPTFWHNTRVVGAVSNRIYYNNLKSNDYWDEQENGFSFDLYFTMPDENVYVQVYWSVMGGVPPQAVVSYDESGNAYFTGISEENLFSQDFSEARDLIPEDFVGIIEYFGSLQGLSIVVTLILVAGFASFLLRRS